MQSANIHSIMRILIYFQKILKEKSTLVSRSETIFTIIFLKFKLQKYLKEHFTLVEVKQFSHDYFLEIQIPNLFLSNKIYYIRPSGSSWHAIVIPQWLKVA